MRDRGVRRVPVVTHSVALAGILTLGDLLDIVAKQRGDVVHAIARKRNEEARIRQ